MYEMKIKYAEFSSLEQKLARVAHNHKAGSANLSTAISYAWIVYGLNLDISRERTTSTRGKIRFESVSRLCIVCQRIVQE